MVKNRTHHPETDLPVIRKNLSMLDEVIAGICEKCGRDPKEVKLVAVTKTHPEEVIMEAYGEDLRDFGENKVQELVPKMSALPDDIVWHMVGTIQTNKIKDLVERVNWIHSISKVKYLKELEKRAARVDRVIRVLIQVNISGEDQKSGCEPEQLPEILQYAAGLKHVTVHGFMGMAALSADRDQIRRQFRMLRDLRDEHRKYETETVRLDELSMGMSGDYDIAIEEGATMIRLGTSIFGSRDYNL